MTKEELETLRDLLHRATPGEWITEYGGGDWTDRIIFIRGSRDTLTAGVRQFVINTVDVKKEDALLIVAARNALGQLIDEIKRLTYRLNHQTEDDAEACRQGKHSPDCGAP